MPRSTWAWRPGRARAGGSFSRCHAHACRGASAMGRTSACPRVRGHGTREERVRGVVPQGAMLTRTRVGMPRCVGMGAQLGMPTGTWAWHPGERQDGNGGREDGTRGIGDGTRRRGYRRRRRGRREAAARKVSEAGSGTRVTPWAEAKALRDAWSSALMGKTSPV